MTRRDHPLHDPAFNALRERAHDFVAGDLQQDIVGVHAVTIVPLERKADLAQHLGGDDPYSGQYRRSSREVFMLAPQEAEQPDTDAHLLVLDGTVHELGHDATQQGRDSALMYPWLFREAGAGFAEQLFLGSLAAKGERLVPPDRLTEFAGAQLWIPGEFRLWGAVTSGLVAAHSFAIAARTSGIDARDVLRWARFAAFTGRTPFTLIDQGYDALRPGLSWFLKRDEFGVSLARIQRVSAELGYLPPEVKDLNSDMATRS